VKVRSDLEADAVYIRLDETPIAESSEVAPGVVLDYDGQGRVVGIELLGVAARLPTVQLRAMDFEIVDPQSTR
jgi:uncharacterized protein YuzE